ncbi:Rad51-domain-containing protein [Baffinella frigidus]|nr:Rad51-domain-containing protein [Cryptophyta sp. CCMP2293]
MVLSSSSSIATANARIASVRARLAAADWAALIRARAFQYRSTMEQAQAPSQVEAVRQQEDEEEEVQSYTDLDVITKHGVTKTDVNKFKDAGFKTLESVYSHSKKVLLAIKGITDAKLEKVLEACGKEKNFSFQTGSEHLLARQKIKRITTGCKALDALLGGGIESNSLTEIYGEFRTGKSQWVHTMCVTGMGKVCIIDTEGAFRSGDGALRSRPSSNMPLLATNREPEKLHAIAEKHHVKGDDILTNLVHARPFTTDHLERLVHDLKAMMVEDGPFSLIMIDSIMGLFRTEFQGLP